MTDVQLPDGRIARFPDSMSQDEILAVLREKFPAQEKRSLGQTIYENVIGSGEIDTPGERLGAAIGDTVNSFGRGVVRGAAGLADLPSTLMGAGFNVAGNAAEAMGANPVFADAMRNPAPLLTDPKATNLARTVTGGKIDDRGDTRAERIAGNIGEFMPAAVAGGAPVSLGVVPGVLSELAGEATEGVKVPESVPLIGGADVEPVARFGAAVAGPSAANVARRVVTPNPADPARIEAAQKLKREGVNVTAGQKTGNEMLKYREALAGRTTQMVADQNQQFTRAALKRIGVNADRATPMVMKKANDDIGEMFETLGQRTWIAPGEDAISAARQVNQTYKKTTARSNISPIVRNITKKLNESFTSGTPITGTQYTNWRSQLSKLTTGADAQLATASRGMIDVLDDAMNRTLAAARQTDDLRLFAKARKQWQDYLAIETALSRAGEDIGAGILNPQVMRNAVAAQGKRPYVLGKRDLGELARQGATVTGKLPQTGAFPRAYDINTGSAFGTGAGALAYAATKDPWIAGSVGLASAALPGFRNAAAASPAGQAYLGNQLLTGRTPLKDSLFPLLSAASNN